jgi:hypothetical protein
LDPAAGVNAERRKAALRQYMPRRELRFIIDRLEELEQKKASSVCHCSVSRAFLLPTGTARRALAHPRTMRDGTIESVNASARQKDARQRQVEIFRRMTPPQRLDCCFRWTNLTYELARSTIRRQHPDWTPEQVDREVGRRITGIDVTKLPLSKPEPPEAIRGAQDQSTSVDP